VILVRVRRGRWCPPRWFSGWIGRYGVPDQLTSDRGAQFTSEMCAAACRRLNITHNMTTAYHPQSNGLVERFHRQLKEALRARLAAAAADWEFHLPWVLLGIRAAPKDDSNRSAAEAVFGQALVLPGQLLAARAASAADQQTPLAEELRSDLSAFVPLPLRARSYAAVVENVPEALRKAEFVYIRRDGVSPALSSKYEGPYRVVSTSPKLFRVMVGEKSSVISIDRLKPHLGCAPVSPAVPPRRGRPVLAALGPGATAGGGTVAARVVEKMRQKKCVKSV
jgi:hypothetical protein